MTLELLLNFVGYALLSYLVIDYGRPAIYQLKFHQKEYWIAVALMIIAVFFVNNSVLYWINEWFN